MSGLEEFLSGFEKKETAKTNIKEPTGSDKSIVKPEIKQKPLVKEPEDIKISESTSNNKTNTGINLKLNLNIRSTIAADNKPVVENKDHVIKSTNNQSIKINVPSNDQNNIQKRQMQEEQKSNLINNPKPVPRPVQVEKVPVINERKDAVSTDEKIEFYFIQSETIPEKKEAWVEMYKKALASKKKNGIVKRMLDGRFRIEKDGEMRMLPNLITKDKTNKDLLSTKWL